MPMPVSLSRTPGRDPRAAAIGRVRRMSRWVTAVATAGTAIVAAAVAHQLPGHSHPAAAATAPASATGGSDAGAAPGAATGSPPSTSGTTTPPSTGAAGAGGLTPPSTAPAPIARTPTVVSGGTSW